MKRSGWIAAAALSGAAWLAGAGERAPAPDARAARLVQELGSDDFGARERATAELRKLGAAAEAELERAAQSRDPEVRDRADLLLREIRWALPPKLAERLGEFAARFAGCGTALEAQRMELLAELRGRAPAEAERYLLLAAREKPTPRAQAELAGLLAIYRSAAAEAAVLAGSRSEDGFCRAGAAESLASFPGERALARIEDLAADGDPAVRRAALSALAHRGPQARPALKAVLKSMADGDEMVRAAAAHAAGRLRDSAAAEKLKALASEKEPAPVRTAAIHALGRLAADRDRETVSFLTGLLDDPLPAVRADALESLVRMRARSAAGRVAELLDDGDPSMAEEAVRALETLGGPEQLPALRRRMEKSRGDALAASAARALVMLGDAPAAEAAAGMLAGKDPAAEIAARALGLTGEARWSRRLAAAAEARPGDEAFRLIALEVRDRQLRDPEAAVERAKLLSGPAASSVEWAMFLADHALQGRAAEIVGRQLAERGDDPALAAEAGVFMVEGARAEEGLALLRRAAEMAPFDATILNNAAWSLVTALPAARRAPEEGLRLARRAAELEPRSGFILDTLGWALFLNGQQEAALAALDEARRWSGAGEGGEAAFVEVHRARVLAGLGRRAEALEALAAAVKLRPRDPTLALDAARVRCALSQPEEARREIERMLELGYPLADVLAADPDLEALRRSPGFKELLEKAVEAREKFRKSLPERPRDAGAPAEGPADAE